MIQTGPFVVGVLALQGGVSEHIHLLNQVSQSHPQLQLEIIQVKSIADLDRCNSLIIPGGESSTLSILAKQAQLLPHLQEFAKHAKNGTEGKSIWGTCAGMIFLSNQVIGALQDYEGIAVVDCKIVRNQFGRQAESFTHLLRLPFITNPSDPFNAIFIRAPIIHSLSSSPSSAPLEPLCRIPTHLLPSTSDTTNPLGPDADCVILRQGNIVLSSFHPELGNDQRVHEWFIRQIAHGAADL
ncbi:SNO glutamine amidotransferase, partial [Meredithblackwellia eburnea MCA 4105]